MLDHHIIFITLTMRDHHVEYSFFVQKFIEFDFIYFQLNYERIIQFKTFVVSF